MQVFALTQSQARIVREILESAQIALVQRINSGKIVNEESETAAREREYQINEILKVL